MGGGRGWRRLSRARVPPRREAAAALVWRGRRAVSRLLAGGGLRGRSGGRPPFAGRGPRPRRRAGRPLGDSAAAGCSPPPGCGSCPPLPRPVAAPAGQLRLLRLLVSGGDPRQPEEEGEEAVPALGRRRGEGSGAEGARRALSPAASGAGREPRSAAVLAEQEGAPFLRAGGEIIQESGKELSNGTSHLGVGKRKQMCSLSSIVSLRPASRRGQ